jgi:serine/threonine-protein kinase
VIRTYAVEPIGGQASILMDLVDGASLRNLLRCVPGMRLSPSVATSIAVSILDGLHAAHEATDAEGHRLAIVHREVSPRSILVGIDGVSRVFDFSGASASRRLKVVRRRDNGALRDLPYMAPEQLEDRWIDRRTDIYRAGVVLWEMLTGVPLHRRDNDLSTIAAVRMGRVIPPSKLVPGITRALDATIARALAIDPDERFRSALEMATALREGAPIANDRVVAECVRSHTRLSLERRTALRNELRSAVSAVVRPSLT